MSFSAPTASTLQRAKMNNRPHICITETLSHGRNSNNSKRFQIIVTPAVHQNQTYFLSNADKQDFSKLQNNYHLFET